MLILVAFRLKVSYVNLPLTCFLILFGGYYFIISEANVNQKNDLSRKFFLMTG